MLACCNNNDIAKVPLLKENYRYLFSVEKFYQGIYQAKSGENSCINYLKKV